MTFRRAILLLLAWAPLVFSQETLVPNQPGAVPAASAVPVAPPAVAVDPNHELGAGDQVTFAIIEDKEAPVVKRVSDSGELDVPPIGRVAVAGKTCDEAAADIKKKLEAQYYYKATVRLDLDVVGRTATAAAYGKVYLSGAIKAPGEQPLLPGEKSVVSAMILKAGGFTQFANKGKVKITRKGKDGKQQTFVRDIGAVLEKGKLDQDLEVKDGDYIFVPQRLISI
jgi:protein involved in polysaccharide export with SLBB domain